MRTRSLAATLAATLGGMQDLMQGRIQAEMLGASQARTGVKPRVATAAWAGAATVLAPGQGAGPALARVRAAAIPSVRSQGLGR